MKIVIPVADELTNPCLPVALATIATHTRLEPLTVGPRDFGLCEHLHVDEANRDKFANEPHAMKTAIQHLGEPFIWSNDDIYWLRPATPIRWAIGNLDDDTRTDRYGRRKRVTAEVLHGLGLPTFDYESHTPLPVNDLEAMLSALELPGAMRSLYGNYTGPPDLVAADVKLRRRDEPTPEAPWSSSEGDPSAYPSLDAVLSAQACQ